MTLQIFRHLLPILSVFFTLLLISKVLRERRAPGSTMAWLLVMALIPYVGVPLYLLLGDRKIKRVAAKKGVLYRKVGYGDTPAENRAAERILLSFGMPPVTSRNQFQSLPSGEEAYAAILRAIDSARVSIHFSTFILGNDPVGLAILAALCKKAEQGVEVRLLLDGVGSFWFPRKRLRRLKKCGGEYAMFVPLFRVPFSGHSNLRNHRKMVLVDGSEGILGGMNAAWEYMGPQPNPHRWTDYSFRVKGEVLRDLEDLFASDWTFASGKLLPPRQEPAPLTALEAVDCTTPVQLIPSGPDVPGDPLYDALLTQIFAATHRIWIATPYFIPDETLARALELACRRGVDVRILLPSWSNHLLADLCRTSYLRQIHGAGGHLCFFRPQMMHAKMILIDDSFALIGSANLDIRSLFLNYEVGIALSAQSSIATIENWFARTFAKTREEAPKNRWGAGVLEGLGRILGPLL